MLTFLGLARDEGYLAAAADAFKVGRGRRKDDRIVNLYADQVGQKFGRRPELRDALLQFAQR